MVNELDIMREERSYIPVWQTGHVSVSGPFSSCHAHGIYDDELQRHHDQIWKTHNPGDWQYMGRGKMTRLHPLTHYLQRHCSGRDQQYTQLFNESFELSRNACAIILCDGVVKFS